MSSTFATADNSRKLSAQLARLIVAGLFFLTVCVALYFSGLVVGGVPVWAMVAVAFLCFIATIKVNVIVDALVRHIRIFLLIGVIALVGIIASIFGGEDPAATMLAVLKVHVQAMVGTLIGICTVRVCGIRWAAGVFCFAILISGVFAALQFVNVGFAWDARNFLDRYDIQTEGMPLVRGLGSRPTGLASSPVALGTELCILFAVWYAYVFYFRGDRMFKSIDYRILLAAAIVVVGSVASGTRSSLLGMLIFLVVYAWMVRPKAALVMSVVGLLFLPVLMELPAILQEYGLRVGETEDKSAAIRLPLILYGIHLFLDWPLGYGLTFRSGAGDWWQYWYLVHHLYGAEGIVGHDLHNFYLVVLNRYGILILPVAFVVLRMMIANWWGTVAFIPYMVHNFFHNGGPLQYHFEFWLALGLFAAIAPAARPAAPGRIRR